jgi:putative restriction endonuclease
MDALKRSLIEKTGHDFGFEYTVSESIDSLTIGSARHRIHAEITEADAAYQVRLTNAKPLLITELQRDFKISDNTIIGSTIQDLATIFNRVAALAHALPNQVENDFESELVAALKKLPDEIKNTEIERLVRQRVGQDTYRKALLKYWGGACAVTGVAIPEILRASHALPWAECETDGQRLDVFNGFLLTANLDALFDRFLISFDEAGCIMVSDSISEEDQDYLGLSFRLRLRWLTDQHEAYLALHRARLRSDNDNGHRVHEPD